MSYRRPTEWLLGIWGHPWAYTGWLFNALIPQFCRTWTVVRWRSITYYKMIMLRNFWTLDAGANALKQWNITIHPPVLILLSIMESNLRTPNRARRSTCCCSWPDWSKMPKLLKGEWHLAGIHLLIAFLWLTYFSLSFEQGSCYSNFDDAKNHGVDSTTMQCCCSSYCSHVG